MAHPCGAVAFLQPHTNKAPRKEGAFLDTRRQRANSRKGEKKKKRAKSFHWTQNTSFELDLIQFHKVNRLGSSRGRAVLGWAGLR